jgi:hypothetical protein
LIIFSKEGKEDPLEKSEMKFSIQNTKRPPGEVRKNQRRPVCG